MCFADDSQLPSDSLFRLYSRQSVVDNVTQPTFLTLAYDIQHFVVAIKVSECKLCSSYLGYVTSHLSYNFSLFSLSGQTPEEAYCLETAYYRLIQNPFSFITHYHVKVNCDRTNSVGHESNFQIQAYLAWSFYLLSFLFFSKTV